MKFLYAAFFCAFAVIVNAFELNSTSFEGKISHASEAVEVTVPLTKFICRIRHVNVFVANGLFITRLLVLTAAKYSSELDIKNINIENLEVHLKTCGRPPVIREFKVRKSYTYDNYKITSDFHNVAVLQVEEHTNGLEGPFPEVAKFEDNLKVWKLYAYKKPEKGIDPYSLQYTDVHKINPTRCSNINMDGVMFNKKQHICGIPPYSHIGQEDIGSMLCNTRIIVGILIFSDGIYNNPSVYTDVFKVKDFIQYVIDIPSE